MILIGREEFKRGSDARQLVLKARRVEFFLRRPVDLTLNSERREGSTKLAEGPLIFRERQYCVIIPDEAVGSCSHRYVHRLQP